MLVLQINSYQKNGSEQPVSKSLETGKLTIGRDSANDWSLADPDRVLSKQHCSIEFINGSYMLLDSSTNGVFVNTGSETIGRGNSVALKNGDTIRISDYEIGVVVSDVAPAAEAIAPQTPPPVVPAPQQPVAPPPPPMNTIPENTDWKSMLESDKAAVVPDQVESEFVPESPSFSESHYDAPNVGMSIPDDWGVDPTPAPPEMPVQPTAVPSTAPVSAPAPPTIPDDFHAAPSISPQPVAPIPAPSAPAPIETPAPAAVAPAPHVSHSNDDHLLKAFLKGAGLDPNMGLQRSPEELMEELGGLFRASTTGLMGVLAARGNIKSEFRLSQTMIKPAENNPLKFSLNIDEAMEALINKKGRGYMTPDAAFEEAFDDLKAHQVAVLSGMQSALAGLLKRFDPSIIKGDGKDVSGMKKILGNTKAKHWDDFEVLYHRLLQETEDDFQNVFGQEFAKAYEQQIHNQKTNK